MTLRLVFMGSPDFAVPALAALVGAGHDIAAVYSQPARPKGRGQAEVPTPVAQFARTHGLALRTPATLRDTEEQEAFAALGADLAVVVAYGLILPKPTLDAPRLGAVNVHASLLPRWRGAAPIQRAIMAGDAETGVMIMQMEEGLDTGPILMAERTAIARKTFGELHDELAQLGADLLVRAVGALERGAVTAVPQSQTGVTYAKKITKDEARLDWRRDARELDCLVRALSPAPGAWFEARSERIRLLLAEPQAGGGRPGEVTGAGLVACGAGALRLLRLQRAGRAPQNAEEFLRGFALPEMLG